MRRLDRSGVEAPSDWQATVDGAFADADAFWKKARAFERLAEHGTRRKKGFVRYAPGVLPLNTKGKPELPPVWQKDDGVRQAIAGMSSGFCAYCQSQVSSSHPGKRGKERPPGQVEHFRPKARFPAQAYDWGNYFFGCAGCNGAKHDKWPVGGYVRPDEGSPGHRFLFKESGDVRAREGDGPAKSTVKDMDLRRYWLVEHRRGAIEAHLKMVKLLVGRTGIQLAKLLVPGSVAFSEAINQNVRRIWAKARRQRS